MLLLIASHSYVTNCSVPRNIQCESAGSTWTKFSLMNNAQNKYLQKINNNETNESENSNVSLNFYQ